MEKLANKYDLLGVVTLLDKMIKQRMISKDPNRPSSIIVYMKADEEHEEGWYSQNIFAAARSLLNDKKSLCYVLTKAQENGIDVEEIISFSEKLLN